MNRWSSILFRAPWLSISGLLISGLLISGCGLGTGGIISLAVKDDSNRNRPIILQVVINSTQSSPALIELTLIDAESNAGAVALSYILSDDPNAEELPLTLITDPDNFPGIGNDLSQLPSSPEGSVTQILWDYQANIGANSLTDIILVARLVDPEDGDTGVGVDPEPLVSTLGNEAPTVQDLLGLEDGITVSGIVPLFFFVTDPAEDDLVINVEYLIQNEGRECDEPILARDAEIPDPLEISLPFPIDTSAQSPDLAFEDLEAEVFFWDTAFFRSDPVEGCDLSEGTFVVDVLVTLREVLESEDDEPIEQVIVIPNVTVTNSP